MAAQINGLKLGSAEVDIGIKANIHYVLRFDLSDISYAILTRFIAHRCLSFARIPISFWLFLIFSFFHLWLLELSN